MRDKFKVNFWIALPPAVITFLIYSFSSGISEQPIAAQAYSIILIIPYLFVLIAALLGMPVIWVLIAGILLSFGIGWFNADLDLWSMIQSINSGMASMFELSIICLVIGGIVGLIKYYGGIDYILHHTLRKINTPRSGEFGIAALTALVNATLANNTITILIVGPLAKNIAEENKIDLRRSASILDTISCFVQGVLPYGAQMLAALAVAQQQISPFDIMSKLYYPYLLGASTLLFILFRRKSS
jgi:Na+/H+ antiporter NhaC